MMHRSLWILLALALALGCVAGCGDDDEGSASGVDSNAYVDELSETDKRTFCAWGIDSQGGPGEVQCDANMTVTVGTVDECVADPAPHCTVGVAEACMQSLGGDPCKLFSTQQCQAFIQCGMGSGQ